MTFRLRHPVIDQIVCPVKSVKTGLSLHTLSKTLSELLIT